MVRIYSESIKKWARNLGITGGTLAGLIFTYLFLIGAISNVSYSGDVVCAGTIDDPCYAYINFTAEEDIFIYPINYDPWGRESIFNFDPNVKSWKLERSWGKGWREIPLNETCTGTWCGAPNAYGVSYSYVFRNNRDYKLRLTAYKDDPTNNIKWGAFSGVDEIDPIWVGISTKEVINDKKYINDIRSRDSKAMQEIEGRLITKEYVANNKEIKIYDDRESTLLNFKLLGDYNKRVSSGKDVLVAELLLIDWGKGANLFDSISAHDLNNDAKDVDKVFITKYAIEETIEVREKTNDSKNIELDLIISDDNYITHEKWIQFSSLDELPSKNIKIGLFTETISGENIEWIPATNGFNIFEFASYLVDDLMSYYPLDETSGTICIDVHGSENGTISGTTTINVDGKFDRGYEFDGGDTEPQVSIVAATPENGSASFWAYYYSLTDYNVIMASGGLSWSIHRIGHIDTNPMFNTYDGTGQDCIATSTNLTINNWYHYVATWGTQGMQLYINGEHVCNNTGYTGNGDGNQPMFLGARAQYYNVVDGKIDEVGVWDIQLDQQAITDLYQGGAGTPYPLDIGNISITLNSPNDFESDSSSISNFNCTSTSIVGNDLTNVTLQVWNSTDSLVLTNTTTITGTTNTTVFNSPVTTAGEYNWGCLTYDNTSYFKASSNRTFYIDQTSPTSSNPSASQTNIFGSTTFQLTIDDNFILHPSGARRFSTNNTGVWVNDSFINFTETPKVTTSIKTIEMSVGQSIGYMWYFYDNAGNENVSEVYSFTVTKATPIGSLSSTGGWSITYPTTTTISYSESNPGDGDVTYKIYRDGIDVGPGETSPSGAGTYNYVLNTTGGVNYSTSANMDSETLTINQNTGACDVLFNETSPIEYPGTFRVWSNCGSDFTLRRNGTIISNNSVQSLSANLYNFSVQRTDTQNYSNIYDDEFFSIISYELEITHPTTGNPKNVTEAEDISVNFNFQLDGSNLTSGVDIESVFIGGQECTILESAGEATPTFQIVEGFTVAPPNWTLGYVTTSGCLPRIDASGTGSSGTGPCASGGACSADGDNWYVYTEMSSSACPTNSYGTITSDFEVDFDNSVVANISFWYHRLGTSLGTKQSLEENSSGSWVEIWSITTTASADTWYEHDVDLTTLDGVGNLRFTIYGNGQWSNDVAYDYINVTVEGAPPIVQEFGYISGVGWQVNITTPTGLSGYQNLFTNATYSGSTQEDTQTNAINYVGEPDTTPPYFTSIPANESITYGNNWTGVDFDAEDETSFKGFYVNDTRFTINSTGFLDDNQIIPVGVHILNVSIDDIAGNINWTLYKFTVNDTFISIDVIYPVGNMDTIQNEFFYVDLNVTCITGGCGTVNATLYANGMAAIVSDYTTNAVKSQHVNEEAPDNNYGTSNNIQIEDTAGQAFRGYVLFDLINITDVLGFLSAEAYLYYGLGQLTGDGHINVTIHDVFSDTWGVDTITWNNQPCEGVFNGTLCNSTQSDYHYIDYGNTNAYMSYNVLSSMQRTYAANDNLSLVLKDFEENSAKDLVVYASYTQGTYPPYLNVTYYTPTSSKLPISGDYTGYDSFYTNASSNPLTTSSLSTGQSETIRFYVNATGDFETYDFYAIANATILESISNETNHWNVTITDAIDTCTYSSGDWEVDCNDNCSISSNVDIGGNDILITGTGSFTTTANITNFLNFYAVGTDASNRCEINCINGGCFN